MDIPGYRLVRSDHPSNDKRVSVCFCFKSSLQIHIPNISTLHECINLKITFDGKLCNLICLFRSPSQNMEEFETFVKNLELNLEFIFNKNPYLTAVVGDFNDKSHIWYKGDKTTASGSKFEIMTFHYGLTQIINKPTHILEDSASCIDLVFTSQPNMVIDSGVHSSLHPNSHHQFLFAKFDLKIYYPTRVSHCKYANTTQIKNAFVSFNWEQALSNSSIDKKISVLNEIIINVITFQ